MSKVNEELAKTLPDLPKNYRWKIVRNSNRYSSKGYIDEVLLQKKNLFWVTAASKMLGSYNTAYSAAREVYVDYFKTDDPNTKLLGVTEL